VLIARPSSRIITERSRQVPGGLENRGNERVLCTEPSPDVAIALARSSQISGSGNAPGGPSVSISGSISSSETASLLAGRTAGVVALRDGLYSACQAYVNGVIGHDAYAVILSRYGNLLVEFVGQGITAKTPGSNESKPQSTITPAAAAGGVALKVADGGSVSLAASQKSVASKNSGPTAPTTPVSNTGMQSVLLVACISEFDETRILPRDQNKQPLHNSLLMAVCPNFLQNLSIPSQIKTAGKQ
jgi:hypothetical protein